MPEVNVDGIRDFIAPVGGWGALKAIASAIRAQLGNVHAVTTLLRSNQLDGFDCPGCVWPDNKHPLTFEFCENGAKAVTK
ncbi:hypothetical protein [Pseudomonas psychrophila]|uniref:hypothetical protein n=1 Tax=Pseudomonas psychrophila TaxID=122355 RepID=UPI0002E5A0AA